MKVIVSKQQKDSVILLHGLNRSNKSMLAMEWLLKRANFDVINVDYPSREHPVETLAVNVLPQALAHVAHKKDTRIHFVTHSMGGILVRYFLKHHSIDRLGRVVMLSPPNQGSQLVDWLRHNKLYMKINGPAGNQLGTGLDSLPLTLGPVNFDLGIITGKINIEPASWLLLPGAGDGKVTVRRAQVEGMADFLVVPSTHTFIMMNPKVAEQTIHFLKKGCFQKARTPEAKTA